MSTKGSTLAPRADPTCIGKLEAVIDQMPPNPEPKDERLSMRQLVHRLYQKILHLKALGYGVRFICKLLQTHSGLPFKPHTLATYLSLEKRVKHSRPGKASQRSVVRAPQRQRAAQSQQGNTSQLPEEVDSAAASEPVPLQKKPAPPLGSMLVHPQDTVPSATSSIDKPNVERSDEVHVAEESPATEDDPAAEQGSTTEPEEKPQEKPEEKTGEQPDSEAAQEHKSADRSPERSHSSKHKPQPDKYTYTADNPPAPESFLDEPMFNLIERD